MILLIALNSSYIHSNLAVWSLKAQLDRADYPCKVLEETINSPYYNVLSSILSYDSDILCFSCYIWNIEIIKKLIIDIGKVRKEIKIVLGGPEVTHCSFELLREFPQVNYIVKGEGESAIIAVIEHINKQDNSIDHFDIDYRGNDNNIIIGNNKSVIDLGKIQNHNTKEFFENIKNKIAYVESSRGCPFSCSYCLSSVDKTIRYFPLDDVISTIKAHIDEGFELIKFTDRTFNINKDRMMRLLKWISEDGENVCFHFEAAGDLFDEETIEFLNNMDDGRVQLEIGIQSSNPEVLLECNRKTNLLKAKSNIIKILSNNNIHVHLDLIVGLPYENFESIINSFEFVYSIKPHQIQLGFLKLLKGTLMREKASEYGMKYMDKPPYQVLMNKWLSFEEIDLLNFAAWAIDKYYNSARFINTLEFIRPFFSNTLDMYIQIGSNRSNIAVSSINLYEELYNLICKKTDKENARILKSYLKFDFYVSHKAKKHPVFLRDEEYIDYKKITREFLSNPENIEKYLPDFIGMKYSDVIKHIHLEIFTDQEEKKVMLFNYKKKNLVTGVYPYQDITSVIILD